MKHIPHIVISLVWFIFFAFALSDWFGDREWVYREVGWWGIPVMCTAIYFTMIAYVMSDDA